MRDLRAIGGWLADESRAIAGYAREPQLWVALCAGLLLWALAYQAPYRYQVDIGGNRETGRRHDDDPFLEGFNAQEPESFSEHPGATPFRWTSDDATIRLPGIGGGRWHVAVKAAGRPDGLPVDSQWDDGSTTTTVSLGALPLVYQLTAAADSPGDLTLRMVTPPFVAPADPRSLGFVMFRVEVASTAGIRWPAAGQLALLAAILSLIYALGRRLAFGPRLTLALALGLAALAAGLLLRERMALTLLTPRLAWILIGAYALGLILDTICRGLLAEPATMERRGVVAAPQPPALPGRAVTSFVAFAPAPRLLARGRAADARFAARRSSLVVGLVVLALVLRLGGMLHPHAIFSDVGLNTNNLLGLTRGEIYFTEGLPSEAGGGRAPYPPAQYVVMAPALLLFPLDRDAIGMILKAGNALWDSLVAGLLWYVLRRGGYKESTALLGAALYVLPPPMLKSLSVGELANVFGQALALPLLALLALQARRLHAPKVFGAAVVLLALALLGHLGVTISLFCVLGYLGLAWLIRLETRRAVRALIAIGLLAGGLVALFYYAPLLDVLRQRVDPAAPAAGSAAAIGVGQRLRYQLDALPAFGVQPIALAIGALGALLVVLRPRAWREPTPRPALGSLLIAWWGGVLLSLGLLLFASQGVRWQQFLYPAVCLGAGLALAAIWQRGRAARLAAGALLAFLAWYGLEFWVTRIWDYLH